MKRTAKLIAAGMALGAAALLASCGGDKKAAAATGSS